MGEIFPAKEPTAEATSAVSSMDGATSIRSAPIAATTAASPSTAAPILFPAVVLINR